MEDDYTPIELEEISKIRKIKVQIKIINRSDLTELIRKKLY